MDNIVAYSPRWGDWKRENGKHCTVKNATVETAGLQKAGRDYMVWNRETDTDNAELMSMVRLKY